MIYAPNPLYTMLSDARCINLYKYLLKHISGLPADIAPDGWENSPYYMLFHETPERAYYKYRKIRANSYKMARRLGEQYTVQPLRSFNDFKRGFTPLPFDPALDTLILYAECIKDIFDRASLVHDGMFNTYKRQGWGFNKNMLKAIKQVFPDEGYEQQNIFMAATYEVVDKRPVYRYIFKLLKLKNLNYLYQQISAKNFKAILGELEGHMAEIQIEKILKEKDNGEDRTEEAYLESAAKQAKEQHEKRMAAIMRIPPFVEAYSDVYGNLPENYPPDDE